MKLDSRVSIKIMHFYVVLNIYETLNTIMSPNLGNEGLLQWKRHFSAKAGHFFLRKMQASFVLETSFLIQNIKKVMFCDYAETFWNISQILWYLAK